MEIFDAGHELGSDKGTVMKKAWKWHEKEYRYQTEGFDLYTQKKKGKAGEIKRKQQSVSELMCWPITITM